MENLVLKGNSKIPRRRKKNSKGKMERNPNLHKESVASIATGMDTSKRNVPTI